jgi:chromate reductase
MSDAVKILAFAGSTREGSINKKLINIAVDAARGAGAEVNVIDLKDYPLPIYDGDDETANGVPENALKLKELFKAHDGMLIATPEYNTSISGVLKNAIDWVSRPVEGESFLECFTGKTVGMVSASLGPFGGLRAQAHLRQILSGINMLVIPEHWGVGSATDDIFNDDGSLKDEMGQGMVQRVGACLAALLQRMAD